MNDSNDFVKDDGPSVQGGHFSLKIQKKNPKKDAPVHKFVTVQDIFNALNEKNVNKFMKEFKQGMQVAIALRELSKALAKENGEDVGDEILQMPSFTWIED